MRVLWVKVGGLWPPDTGGRIRSFRMLSELSRRNPVKVLTTHRDPEEAEGLRASLADCESVDSVHHEPAKAGSARFALDLARSWASPLPVDVLKWRSPELLERVRGELRSGEIDVAVADFLVSFESVPSAGRAPVVLFEHNVEYRIWQRLARSETRRVRKALLEIEWRKMRAFEAGACAGAARTICVSSTDRDELARLAPGGDFRVTATGVDTVFFAPGASGRREAPSKLVFTGSMDWYPNEDAVTSFVAESFPRIREAIPEATFDIVGRNPSARVRSLEERGGVRVTGTVPDVRPSIDEAAVYVVPLRVGSGTRLKIFEALAMGKAVVSTGVGAEGLPLVPGEHYVRADDPREFAMETIALLRHPGRRRALGAAGRRLVEEKFDWKEVTRAFENDLAGAEARTEAPVATTKEELVESS